MLGDCDARGDTRPAAACSPPGCPQGPSCVSRGAPPASSPEASSSAQRKAPDIKARSHTRARSPPRTQPIHSTLEVAEVSKTINAAKRITTQITHWQVAGRLGIWPADPTRQMPLTNKRRGGDTVSNPPLSLHPLLPSVMVEKRVHRTVTLISICLSVHGQTANLVPRVQLRLQGAQRLVRYGPIRNFPKHWSRALDFPCPEAALFRTAWLGRCSGSPELLG